MKRTRPGEVSPKSLHYDPERARVSPHLTFHLGSIIGVCLRRHHEAVPIDPQVTGVEREVHLGWQQEQESPSSCDDLRILTLSHQAALSSRYPSFQPTTPNWKWGEVRSVLVSSQVWDLSRERKRGLGNPGLARWLSTRSACCSA